LVKQVKAAEYDQGRYDRNEEREHYTAVRLTGGRAAIISSLGHDAC